jgi:type IV pilus assembly protein PilB
MAKGRGDFTDVLLRKKIISADQLREALQLQKSTGAKLADALVKLGYVTPSEVMQAIAEHHGLQAVDLNEVSIPPAVIELVPESVARGKRCSAAGAGKRDAQGDHERPHGH